MQAAVDDLRRRGERVTPARKAVLEVLNGTQDHLTAEEIIRRAADRAPGVHRATVYRALSTLGDLDLVTHTHIGGSATVYHLADLASPAEQAPRGHAHLQCTSCGVVIDVPAGTLDSVLARLHSELDFRLDAQHAALLGTCGSCQRRESER